MTGRTQEQHKTTGCRKAPEEAVAQLLTSQMLSAEAVLLFWQHCWDLPVLTGDQGNVSSWTTMVIVESPYETAKMRWLTCISDGGKPASAVNVQDARLHYIGKFLHILCTMHVTWLPSPIPIEPLGSTAQIAVWQCKHCSLIVQK